MELCGSQNPGGQQSFLGFRGSAVCCLASQLATPSLPKGLCHQKSNDDSELIVVEGTELVSQQDFDICFKPRESQFNTETHTTEGGGNLSQV